MMTVRMHALFVALLMMSALPLHLEAATLRAISEGESAGIAKQVVVSLLLETDSEPVNAVEGYLRVHSGMHVDAIETGGSALSLWVQTPSFSPADGVIAFSGGVPGGIPPHSDGVLFTVRAHANEAGEYAFTPGSIVAYRNDGEGTREPVEVHGVTVTVDTSSSEQTLTREAADTPLMAEVGSDPSLFDGRYFLSFYGGDNGSGIIRYEVKEGWWRSFEPVDRYYLLEDQDLTTSITVRAYRGDGSHAETHMKASASNLAPLLVGGLLVVSALMLILWRRSIIHRNQ